MPKTIKSNKDKRTAVLEQLQDMNATGENLSNSIIAKKAGCSPALVQLIKQQTGWKSTSHLVKSKSGREINTKRIGSATKLYKKRIREQKQKAQSKKETLDNLADTCGADLEKALHRCDVCKNYFVSTEPNK